MTNKKDENALHYLRRTIKTQDGALEYPIDIVREMYMLSDKNLEDLALQMNLPLAIVEQHARAGLKSWEQLKQEMVGERMRYFARVNIDNAIESHAFLEDGHLLTLVQYKGMLAFLKAYFAKHGHLWRVDEAGEMSLDHFGLPIPLPLPNTPKHFMALEGFFRLKDGTKQVMNDLYEATKKDSQPDVVDVESYGLFDSDDKP